MYKLTTGAGWAIHFRLPALDVANDIAQAQAAQIIMLSFDLICSVLMTRQRRETWQQKGMFSAAAAAAAAA